ncbi:MAG: hypothetical protein K2W82_13495 [Candidatus Obscuribacterales bacterium]|nr:hypothetical protein [Candidatus Obscuribacterales bacterium]
MENDQPEVSLALEAARERAVHGDVERAAVFFEKAISQVDTAASQDLLVAVLAEAIEYFANERLDGKLIPLTQRFIELVQPLWQAKDIRYLPYLDHLCRAYYRQKDYDTMEKHLLRSLEFLLVKSGEKTAEYANRLEYAASLLSEAGRHVLAAKYKAKSREIRRELSKALEIQSLPRPTKSIPEERKIYLGLILTYSGMVPSPQFQEHLRISKQLGLPVGEVLVSAGMLTEEQLFYSLQLQAMARADQISLQQAADIFKLLCRENISWEESLARFGVGDIQVEDKNRLGRILESAGFITDSELKEAIAASAAAHIPLGRHFVVTRMVAPTIVAMAIELQQLIINGQISREQAIAKLSHAASGMTLMESIPPAGADD